MLSPRSPLRSSVVLIVLLCCAFIASAQSGADDCIGIWKTGNGKGHVQIFKQGGKYFGRIVWLKEPDDPQTGKPKLDKANEDKSKRSRPIMGLTMLRDFEWSAKEKAWTDGYIYDPEKGKYYSCVMRLKDGNTLHVRGYIMSSTFGRTDIWKRQPR